MVDYKEIIKKLNLQPLDVEGGYFNKIITLKNADDVIGSCIYYLVTPNSFSSLHKVLKDEIWYFLDGDPLIQIIYDNDKNFESIELGKVVENYKSINLVKKDVWQATKLLPGGKWALVATTVIPGFGENDFISYDDDIINELSDKCDINQFVYR
ncbi:MAG: cupin domain-containing protein [Pleomorphochaeta sp.]